MLQRPRGEILHSDFNTQSRSNLLQTEPRIAELSNGSWVNGCPCACHMAITFNFNLIMKSSGPYYKAHPLTIVLCSPLHSAIIANYTHAVHHPFRYTSYNEVCLLLQGIPPITRYTAVERYIYPYCEVYPLLQGSYTPYCEVYPLLQGIPPILRYTPYCEVYPLLQGIPPIGRYTPYSEVYPLLQGIPPILRYTLLRGIPPIARYICAIAHKIYPLIIAKHTLYYKVANFDTNYAP